MRKSTLELPTAPTLPSPAVQPHRRLPWQALHVEPMTTQVPRWPTLPHRGLPTGTEGRTLGLEQEELVQDEIEGVFELSGF